MYRACIADGERGAARHRGGVLRCAAQHFLSNYSLNRSARRLGAVLRQAATSAGRSVAFVADRKITLVAPRRPQPPFTGTKTFGLAFMKMSCCSGVSFTIAQPARG